MPTCPHCGHDADASADECPLCGTPMGGAARGDEGPGGAGGGADAPAARPGEDGDEGPVPWEDPSLGFAAGIWETWRESLFEPARFFGRIRDEGTVGRALLYFLLVSVATSFAALVWEARGLTIAHMAGYVEAGGAAAAGRVVSFVLSPVLALVIALVLTVIFHLGALMAAPDRRGMGATARVVCYAAGPSVLAVVPIVGPVVGAVWSVVLQVVGLREVHRTTTLRGVFMVFWLWLVFAVFAVLMGLVVAWLGGSVDGGALVLGGAGLPGPADAAPGGAGPVPIAPAGA